VAGDHYRGHILLNLRIQTVEVANGIAAQLATAAKTVVADPVTLLIQSFGNPVQPAPSGKT
jgi:hypothetical protein